MSPGWRREVVRRLTLQARLCPARSLAGELTLPGLRPRSASCSFYYRRRTNGCVNSGLLIDLKSPAATSPRIKPADRTGPGPEVRLSPTLRESCGVFGVYSPHEDVARIAFYGLYALQHRGQESAGIASANDRRLYVKTGMGLVSQVFDEDDLSSLPGKMAIGHNRYSTTGSSGAENAQPCEIEVNGNALALGHNGNLVNAEVLRSATSSDRSQSSRVVASSGSPAPTRSARRSSKTSGSTSPSTTRTRTFELRSRLRLRTGSTSTSTTQEATSSAARCSA